MGTATGGVGLVVLVVALVIAACGLVLLIWGLRGKKLNDHPLCKRCRFDLSGLGDLKAQLGPDGSVSASKCPECGSEVWKPGNVRVGQRRRARLGGVSALAGVLLLALGLAGTGGFVAQRVSKKAVYAAMPNWMLLEMTSGRFGGVNETLMDEVVSRLPKVVSGPGVNGGSGTSAAVVAPGSWTDEQLGVLAGRAASGVSGSTSTPIVKDWLSVYLKARSTPGLTTKEQDSAVAAASTGAFIEMRPVVRRAQELFVNFRPAPRLPLSEMPGVVWVSRRMTIQSKNALGTWSEPEPVNCSPAICTQNMAMGLTAGVERTPLNWAPGEYEIRLRGEYVTLIENGLPPFGGTEEKQDAYLESHPKQTTEWFSKLRVVAETDADVELDTSEAAGRIARSIRVAMLRWKADAVKPRYGVAPQEWEPRVLIESNVAFNLSEMRVLVQPRDAQRNPIGEAWSMPSHTGSSYGTSMLWLAGPIHWADGSNTLTKRLRFDAASADIEIEPSLSSLERSLNTKAFGYRVKFTDVHVIDRDGSVTDFQMSPGMLSKVEFKAFAVEPSAVETMTAEDLIQGQKEENPFRRSNGSWR